MQVAVHVLPLEGGCHSCTRQTKLWVQGKGLYICQLILFQAKWLVDSGVVPVRLLQERCEVTLLLQQLFLFVSCTWIISKTTLASPSVDVVCEALFELLIRIYVLLTLVGAKSRQSFCGRRR